MSNKNHVKSQEPIKEEDLKVILDYILSQEIKDEKHAKTLRRLFRRTVTMSDVVVVYQALSRQQSNMITQIMEKIQVHQTVLDRLGATSEMYEEAWKEYNQKLKDMEEEIKRSKGGQPEISVEESDEDEVHEENNDK